VQFTGRATTTTRIAYSASYGRSAPTDFVAAYLYGTGSVWAGAIETIKLIVINHADRWIYDLAYGEHRSPEAVSWTGETEMIVSLHNVEPAYTDTVRIHLGPPLFDRGPRRMPGSYWLDERVIPEDDLKLLSTPQLRLLRNLIFAIHGYRFRSPDLQTYFGEQKWYEPSDAFSPSDLNEVERQNVDLILRHENRREQTQINAP
jgi:hypothetical protein